MNIPSFPFRQTFCALLFCAPAQAGPVRFSAGLWDYAVSGYEVDHGIRRDFERDLAVKSDPRLQLALEYDWRESWYPDLAARYSQYGGDGRVTTSGATGGGLLSGGGAAVINTRADLTDIDITARWPLELGSVLFSPGLTLKRLSGEVVIEDGARQTTTTQRLDEIFPQFHAELYWNLHPRFALSATVQAVAYGENAANEWRALAVWQVYGPVQLQAGWQEKRLDTRQPDLELHARLRGLLFQAGLIF